MPFLMPPVRMPPVTAPSKAPRRWVTGAILVLGVGGGLMSFHRLREPRPVPSAPEPPQSALPTSPAELAPAQPLRPSGLDESAGIRAGARNGSDFWANLPTLLWPLVAIVAIVALFLIARQAISTGNNVTIQWKVTEKVTGRVVITKVRERSPRNSKAA